ncbi:amidase [Devosia sp. ZW T5_3]|uniref:amidase n=1 Tax=Devosia sp. ZW T5_3 TaxID=3378085 RepID=UPI003854427F
MTVNKDATALAADLATGVLSARDLTETAIAAIEAKDGAINAVVVHDFDRARRAAVEADKRLAAGERLPLLGVPVTIKESFDTAGLPTSWGLEAFRHAIAAEDAVVVGRLRAAGAIILGKTNVSEGLSGWNATNAVYGRTDHPLAPGHTPGGSSSGAAAAIAAGLSALDIGSDLGGSIRGPAHFCGIFGHNSTAGLLPLRGHVLAGRKARLDMSAPGPMANSARDLALGLSIMAGPDLDEATGYRLALPAARHDTVSDFRVLVLPEHPLVPTEPCVRQAVETFALALARRGASVQSALGIIPDPAQSTSIYMALLGGALGLGQTAEAAEQGRAKVAALLPEDQSISAMRLRASVISHADWLVANEARVKLRRAWRELFKPYDAVICPPTSVPALTHADAAATHIEVDGQTIDAGDTVAWASLATAAGLPATVMPVGKTPDGRPLGVQIIGPYLEDYTPIRLAELMSPAEAN